MTTTCIKHSEFCLKSNSSSLYETFATILYTMISAAAGCCFLSSRTKHYEQRTYLPQKISPDARRRRAVEHVLRELLLWEIRKIFVCNGNGIYEIE